MLQSLNIATSVTEFYNLPSKFSPYVAAFSLIDNQQVSVDFIYEFWCNPAQRHPNLVLGYEIVLLHEQT